MSYEAIRKNPEAYRALHGDAPYFMTYDEKTSFPFGRTTVVESGGTWRCGVPVSIYLEATDENGIRVRMFFDLEKRTSSPTLDLDFAEIETLRKRLPSAVRSQLAACLKKVLVEFERRTEEEQEWLKKHMWQQAKLEALCRDAP